MLLDDFLKKISTVCSVKIDGKSRDVTLRGVTDFSKHAQPGFVFVAIQGERVDGTKFIEEAVQRGASVIVAHPEACRSYAGKFSDVAFIETDCPKKCLAHAAAILYPSNFQRLVAVTGTNGKSSTVDFVRQIWEYLGYKAASIGTLGIISRYYHSEKHLTTPDPVYLHKKLQDLEKAGVTHVALEASSHGLDQYRLDGLKFHAAGLSSFGRDHLDYHQTMEAYLRAKGRLFLDLLHKPYGVAVLNRDTHEVQKFKSFCEGAGVTTYGQQVDSDFQITDHKALVDGQSAKLVIFGKAYAIKMRLMGLFQLYNALCALGLAISDSKVKVEEAVKILERLKEAPGRLEYVTSTKKGTAVYVDYAHAADAIQTVLEALRQHSKKGLWIVFGGGGGRDPGTRPLMGQAAQDYADHVIICDDNPRFEDPDKIRDAIKKGASGAHDIADRREAIAYALRAAQSGDIILVAGKGPEDGQIIQGTVYPFLDRQVILDLIQGEGL